MPSHSLCPWRMQVHHIQQETPDVWTLSLINHDFYCWQAGQFALVKVAKSDRLRAYTLSSTPGQSEFITLTVRHINGGKGSGWLTQEIKVGDYIWLSDPQGEFTCEKHPSSHYLMLSAGCGITPIMSMCRWLHHHHQESSVKLIYCIRSRRDAIFYQQLIALQPWLDLTFIMEDEPTEALPEGRLTQRYLNIQVPDIAKRTVMICGPQVWMEQVEGFSRSLGANEIWQERFTPVATDAIDEDGESYSLRSSTHPRAVFFPAGATLLAAMEKNHLPVESACRSGVCGCCKTQVVRGEYKTQSTQTLTHEEIAAGYVLACSCIPASDIELA
nr:NADH oxidoreductase [Pantoea sp. 201603H]